MNLTKKRLIPFIIGIIVISLSSCTPPSTDRQQDSASLPSPETPATPLTTPSDSGDSGLEQSQPKTPVAAQPLNPNPSGKATTAQGTKMVGLNIYHADSQCEKLVPEKVEVPAETPAKEAVGKVLQRADSSDFELAGYRVNINPDTRIATVDLRRAPDTQREFVSLSACEQLALFGSLRKTLLENPQLKIKEVRFTEQGQDIEL